MKKSTPLFYVTVLSLIFFNSAIAETTTIVIEYGNGPNDHYLCQAHECYPNKLGDPRYVDIAVENKEQWVKTVCDRRETEVCQTARARLRAAEQCKAQCFSVRCRQVSLDNYSGCVKPYWN